MLLLWAGFEQTTFWLPVQIFTKVVGMHIYINLHFLNTQTWGRSIPISSTSLTVNNAYPAACSNNTCKSTWEKEGEVIDLP